MTDDRLHDEPFEVEVLSSESVFDGHVWAVRSETFDYNGVETTREFVDHPGAAAVVAIDDERRVLLIQQYRHAIRGRDWEIPAGLLDVPGEDPLETAHRELAEEADLVAEEMTPLVVINTTPGGSDEVVHIYLATRVSAAPQPFAREEEEADLRVEWVPLDEVVDAVLEGRMRNSLLSVGVLAAAERLRRAERSPES